jgi:superfamily I DNA/RNA helicase
MGRKPNPGQRQAVEADKDSALFVVAGPGTGKTATLTMRILKLVQKTATMAGTLWERVRRLL